MSNKKRNGNSNRGNGSGGNRMNVQDHQNLAKLRAMLPDPEEDFEPIRVIERTEEERAEEDRIILFFIGEKAYSIPKQPRANVALKYLRDLRDSGDEIAQANMLAGLLGEEGFNALCDSEDVLTEQFEAIVNIAAARVLGALEQTSKN